MLSSAPPPPPPNKKCFEIILYDFEYFSHFKRKLPLGLCITAKLLVENHIFIFLFSCFSRVDTKHMVNFDIFFIYFLFHHLSFRKTKRAYSCLRLNYSLFLFKGWFHLTVILFSTKCFLFVYIFIDLLKLTAYKLFENSDADLSWFLFLKEAKLYRIELIEALSSTHATKIKNFQCTCTMYSLREKTRICV